MMSGILSRVWLLLILSIILPAEPRFNTRPRVQDDLPPIAVFLPLQAYAAPTAATPAARLIAFVPDGLAVNDFDEAVAVQNTGRAWMSLSGWRFSDGEGTITLPELGLAPGQIVWCAQQAVAFRAVWARPPDCEYGKDTDPTIPNAVGTSPRLANTGDELRLLDPAGDLADVVVFGTGDTNSEGWLGDAVAYYTRNTRFSRSGQVFYRLFEPGSGLPLADTDTLHDWAQGHPDPARGRRAAYPGWNLVHFSQPAYRQWPPGEQPTVRVLTAPDNTFTTLRAWFAAAQSQIVIEAYQFDHPQLVAVLAERAQAGVDVSLLLEGAPVGGLTDDTRWAAQQIVQAGGDVRFMVNDVEDAHDRYAYVHAKFAVIDGRSTLISTENFRVSSMPPDAADGDTLGRRGYGLIIDDPEVAAAALGVFAADANPAHPDIFAWQPDHPIYGPPPPGFQPPVTPNLSGYRVRYPQAQSVADASAAYLFSSPESSLTPGPLLDLINRAGAGDVILSQQLAEDTFWGPSDSTPAEDPNPRLEAMIAAARRGASVRILLDGYFDNSGDARSNAATILYVNTIAAAEDLDLQAATANPSGDGLHAKTHLIRLGPESWSVIGSINGGEVSNKLNREIAIALRSDQTYAHLAATFWTDWPPGAMNLSTGNPGYPPD